MTNQMKLILKISLIASGASFLTALVLLFVGEVGFLSVISYFILVLSAIVFVINLVLYLNTISDLRKLKQQIAYYQLLKKLRNDAIIDFYHRFGLTPQYDKNGKLITPDELLGILTKLDPEGKLDASIYERLGILPMFDKNGKEIPVILVLKHLIKSIKTEGLKELNKFKGLFLKGSKKEKKAEQKKAKPVAKKADGGKKKGKKKSDDAKVNGTFVAPKKEEKGKKGKKADKKDKKAEPKKEVKAEPKAEPQKVEPQPIITKIDKKDLPKKEGYLSKIYGNEPVKANRNQENASRSSVYESGEVTPE